MRGYGSDGWNAIDSPLVSAGWREDQIHVVELFHRPMLPAERDTLQLELDLNTQMGAVHEALIFNTGSTQTQKEHVLFQDDEGFIDLQKEPKTSKEKTKTNKRHRIQSEAVGWGLVVHPLPAPSSSPIPSPLPSPCPSFSHFFLPFNDPRLLPPLIH